MTKKKAKKDGKKKGKKPKDPPPDNTGMGSKFDDAMTRIAKAPWPPPKKKEP